MNPQFKPKPPLSDTTRTAIFKLYQTKKSTPRELADEFGISLVRTEAILRLKALQQTLPQSLMQSDFSLKMDQALASETITPSKTRREPLRQPTLNPIAPFLQFLNEEDSFTPADAAHLLLREPFANITRKLNIKASSIFHVSEPVSESNQPLDDEIISKDDFQTSKNNLMFVDTSTSKMLVRESNGVLRNANKVERWNKVYCFNIRNILKLLILKCIDRVFLIQ
jgi:hypothetical protein